MGHGKKGSPSEGSSRWMPTGLRKKEHPKNAGEAHARHPPSEIAVTPRPPLPPARPVIPCLSVPSRCPSCGNFAVEEQRCTYCGFQVQVFQRSPEENQTTRPDTRQGGAQPDPSRARAGRQRRPTPQARTTPKARPAPKPRPAPRPRPSPAPKSRPVKAPSVPLNAPPPTAVRDPDHPQVPQPPFSTVDEPPTMVPSQARIQRQPLPAADPPTTVLGLPQPPPQGQIHATPVPPGNPEPHPSEKPGSHPRSLAPNHPPHSAGPLTRTNPAAAFADPQLQVPSYPMPAGARTEEIPPQDGDTQPILELSEEHILPYDENGSDTGPLELSVESTAPDMPVLEGALLVEIPAEDPSGPTLDGFESHHLGEGAGSESLFDPPTEPKLAAPCPRCHTKPSKANAVFCEHCGTKMRRVARPKAATPSHGPSPCIQCGVAMPSDLSLCPNCHARQRM